MVNKNMVRSEIKYKIVYVFKGPALKVNVKSRKYTRYLQWQYGDRVIAIDFECWFFAEKILNTLIHYYYYDQFKATSVILCEKNVTRLQNKSITPMAKTWRDFSTSLPSLIFRELWLQFTKYIFLRNLKTYKA